MSRAGLLIINLLLFGSSICLAQYSDQQLYRAYLHRDMHIWEAYLADTDFAQAPLDEQLRYLNYQYGYVAYAISINHDNARQLLTDYEANLETLRPQLPQATYLAYKAGASSYELSLNHWLFGKYGKQIYSEVNRALSADPANPLAQTMKGNVEFYGPMGSKHEALKHYEKADILYRAQGVSPWLWNVRAVQLTLVQCIDKTQSREAAIVKCRQILAEEPDFLTLKELYPQE